MKKLMLVAAAAIVAGSSFAACEITPTPEKPTVTNAAVYAWKFTGKTVIGKMVNFKSVNPGLQGSNCQLGTPDSVKTDTCAIRVPGSLAIQGYVYYCDNCCDVFTSGTAGATINPLASFYMTKPFKDVFTQADITIDLGHIIGTKATQYETKGIATFNAKDPSVKYTLTFAGLGSYDQKLAVVKSVSGNFAGTAASPYYVGKGVCVPADYWTCAIQLACAPTDDSVAYGTWSVKYNSSASKKYRNNGTLIKLPSWTGLN